MPDTIETKLLTVDLRGVPVDEACRQRIIEGIKQVVSNEIASLQMTSNVKIKDVVVGKDWPGGGFPTGILVEP